MQLGKGGLVEIESSEGWSSGPYWDNIGKVWTAYFGETQGIGPNSPKISRASGEARLKRKFAEQYAWALKPFINLKGFTQNMYDALGSFIWNCGTGAVGQNTTVGKLLRQRKWSAAANALLAWCKGGGRVIAGLLARRKREAALMLKRVAHTAAFYLTDWEKKTVKILTDERTTSKRHGGWEHVDPSHLARAKRAKDDLRERVKTLKASDPNKNNRKQRIEALTAVISAA